MQKSPPSSSLPPKQQPYYADPRHVVQSALASKQKSFQKPLIFTQKKVRLTANGGKSMDANEKKNRLTL